MVPIGNAVQWQAQGLRGWLLVSYSFGPSRVHRTPGWGQACSLAAYFFPIAGTVKSEPSEPLRYTHLRP